MLPSKGSVAMNAYVLIVVISQILGGSGNAANATQYAVGEYQSMEQCREAARSSEVVHSVNAKAGPKPRIDFLCVRRSKL